jgi:hypothetical protein
LILIIYHQKPRTQRKAIENHLLSFGNAYPDRFMYWNIAYGLPAKLAECNFEAVIFHFTFFIPNITAKFDGNFKKWHILKKIDAPKSAIVQDEYIHTESLCNFFKEFGIETVFSCLPSSLYEVAYPFEKSGVRNFHTVLTGYIDDEMLANYGQYTIPYENRKYHIGYRARMMPYNLGIFATYKWKLTEVFQKALVHTKFNNSISNDPNDFLFGKSWFEFVANCRFMLGCEGGSSLHDPDGSIKKCCDDYLINNPSARFEEVEEHCFKGKDGTYPYYALSPRHFEAIISKTGQILIEGQYNNILKPDIHYIPIKKDWSNMSEVLKKIEDSENTKAMTERAYSDIIENGKYRYQDFVNYVIANISTKNNIINKTSIDQVNFLHKNPFFASPILYSKAMLVEYTKRIVWKTGIDKMHWFKILEFRVLGGNAVR